MDEPITVSFVIAMAPDRLIGTATGLPWHLPSDLKRFRLLTTGKPIILGRKTAQLIGKPLPNRENIILTTDRNFVVAGSTVVNSVADALAAAQRYLDSTNGNEIMVVGGAQIYDAFLQHCRRIYLTVVEGKFDGITYYPIEKLDDRPWLLHTKEKTPADEKNAYSQRFYRIDSAPNDLHSWTGQGIQANVVAIRNLLVDVQ